MMACELSFYPLGVESYLPVIDRVLDVIADSGLEAEVGAMSTLVRGDRAALFALLDRIAADMDAAGCRYAMRVTLSNTCGIDP